MMTTLPDREWLTRSHITGPTYLKLAVSVSSTLVCSPTVELTEKFPHATVLDDHDVAASVLRGADKANTQYHAQMHPVAIRYACDGHNALSRIEYVTFKMIEAAAIPRFAVDLQAAINNSDLSYHKLAQATAVPKSVLSGIARSAAVAEVEPDILVRLLKYFRIITEVE
jgi:hypothetical protein